MNRRLLGCSYVSDSSVKCLKGGKYLWNLDYSKIGKRIARRRKELGLKQAEVCERAGINDKYLSCIERATSIPSLKEVMRFALPDIIEISRGQMIFVFDSSTN